MNYQSRAKMFRTPAQAKYFDEQEQNRTEAKGGRVPVQYLAEKVRTKEDLYRYFELYHPEYPPILCQALTIKILTLGATPEEAVKKYIFYIDQGVAKEDPQIDENIRELGKLC